MGYFRQLGLEKEPFSTSPDPDFFYLSKEHDVALTNVLIELYLRRGLSVILGDIGTGKTTLSRKLIQCLTERGDFVLNILLDPVFKNERHFLHDLMLNFGREAQKMAPSAGMRDLSSLELKRMLQRYLYEQCVVRKKTVVVIVDEAQKLSRASLEMLRVILNYETNESKMLQLVLLGQMELRPTIAAMPNFSDRISFKYQLNPLSAQETADLIDFRLRRAGYEGRGFLFQREAVELIHEASRGYPRKITQLCHRALKNTIMRNEWAVNEEAVREIVDEDVRLGWPNPILH